MDDKGIFGKLPKSKAETEPIPVRDQFDTTEQYAEKLRKRFEKPVCVGSAKFKLYNIKEQIFPLKVTWEKWFEKLAWKIGELYISIENEPARELYHETSEVFPIYATLAVGTGENSVKISIKSLFLLEMGKRFPVFQSAKQIHEEKIEEIPEPVDDKNAIPFAEKGQFEKTEEFKERLEKIFEQPLHAGWVKLNEEKYDADTEKFKLKIEWKKWFKRYDFYTGELHILVEPQLAFFLYKKGMQYPLYVRLAVEKGNIKRLISNVKIGITSIVMSALDTAFTAYQIGDDEAWEKAKRDNTIESYHNYLENDSLLKQHVQKAWQLEDDRAWEKAKKVDTIESYQNYLNGDTLKKYKEEALKLINVIEYNNDVFKDDKAWEKAKKADTIESYQNYLNENTLKKYKQDALNLIDDRAWEKAKKADTIESYQNYLNGNTLKRYKQEALDEEAWKQARRKNTLKSYQNYLRGNTLKKYKTEAQTKITELIVGGFFGSILISLTPSLMIASIINNITEVRTASWLFIWIICFVVTYIIFCNVEW